MPEPAGGPIPARLLAALRDLDLVARRVVEGTRFGVHPSRAAGEGIEFSQFRSYQPGDDLRRVDWKLYARSERFFVREAERETSLTVRLGLDASGSMAYEEDGVSLLALGRVVAAALALVADRQGDTVALYPLTSEGSAAVVRPARERRQLARILTTLARLEPAGVLPACSALEAMLLDGSHGITVLITDLHEQRDEVRAAATRLARIGHDVAIIHLVGRRQREFAYSGVVTFEELETGRRVEVDAESARAGLLAAQSAAWRSFEQEFAGQDVSYVRVGLDEPLEQVLSQYLRLRARRP